MSWFEGWDFDLSTGDEFDTGEMDLSVDDIDTGDSGFDYEWFDESGDGSGTNWWNSFTGQNSNGQGGNSTNWLGLLMSGYSQYQGQRNQDRNAQQGREHDIALTILRDQLANKEYDRRQQQLKDAYAAVPASQNANYAGLLGSWSPRPVQQGTTYNGY